jgi:hypothetical protein
VVIIILAVAVISFVLSASAGLGGSLILVPALSLVLGPKQGIALAAVLLGSNNVFKVLAYRKTIPIKSVLSVLVLTVIGAALGANLLVAAPENWIRIAIVLSIGLSFLLERIDFERLLRLSAPVLAFFAGATSGFSGTSGPLKGIALRNLALERMFLVGAASVVSLANDAIKTAIFIDAELLNRESWVILLMALPLMPLATLAGRHFNTSIGERAYGALFWAVMIGYTIRLFFI